MSGEGNGPGLRAGDDEQAAVARDPDRAVGALEQGARGAVETLGRTDPGRPVFPDARHARILGADPEAAGPVAQHRPDKVARQALASGQRPDGAVLESVESAAVGPYPEAPFAVFTEGPDEIVGESVACVEGCDDALAQAREATAVGADPEIAVAVEGERPDALVRQALFFSHRW